MKFILRAQMVLGAWLIVSPWILEYSGVTPALWSGVLVGSFFLLLALWGMYGGLEPLHDDDEQKKS